jgi:hypothetical protein
MEYMINFFLDLVYDQILAHALPRSNPGYATGSGKKNCTLMEASKGDSVRNRMLVSLRGGGSELGN